MFFFLFCSVDLIPKAVKNVVVCLQKYAVFCGFQISTKCVIFTYICKLGEEECDKTILFGLTNDHFQQRRVVLSLLSFWINFSTEFMWFFFYGNQVRSSHFTTLSDPVHRRFKNKRTHTRTHIHRQLLDCSNTNREYAKSKLCYAK